MKQKLIVAAAAAAAALIAGAAHADQIGPVTVGSSFTDVIIGTIHVASTSDVVGSLFALDSASVSIGGQTMSFSLQSVVFSGASVGSLVDSDPSAAGFSFTNVSAGDYVLTATGYLTGSAQISGTGFLGANYTATPAAAVPEPQSYALLAVGLGLVGWIARRRGTRAI
ncbi:FxDxF family PEP-CTERM protein [Paucibacter sp. R3-3]|uniref:FxDxF family PEP-CTERM protein n=1 Tax=Roseateles agri TaxID=3098619 RepID=A0ABU5DCQ1_9BURK|nr:FxDxF family PEP-CTERM protein [Paucibacter sp. R3-3]MDY0743566.1 FxDxF family PEP-CTERM protein [Paucibacter sp. R3-3]